MKKIIYCKHEDHLFDSLNELTSLCHLDPGAIFKPLGMFHPGVIPRLPVPKDAPTVKTFTFVSLTCVQRKKRSFIVFIFFLHSMNSL